MARQPPAAIPASSTDSDPDNAIDSTMTQFRPSGSQRKGKTPAWSHVSTQDPQLPQFPQRQLQCLEREKGAAVKELQKMKDQQASNAGLLQKTATAVHNTANMATTQKT